MARRRQIRVGRSRQLQVLTSPVRMEILIAAGSLRDFSAAELAQSLGRTQSSLYFHLDRLVDAGLLERADQPGGARYAASGTKAILTYAPEDPALVELVVRNTGAVLRAAERAIGRALSSGRARLRGRAADTLLTSGRAFLRPDELAELREHVAAIERLLVDAAGSRKGKLVTFTACLAPVVARRQKRGSG